MAVADTKSSPINNLIQNQVGFLTISNDLAKVQIDEPKLSLQND